MVAYKVLASAVELFRASFSFCIKKINSCANHLYKKLPAKLLKPQLSPLIYEWVGVSQIGLILLLSENHIVFYDYWWSSL